MFLLEILEHVEAVIDLKCREDFWINTFIAEFGRKFLLNSCLIAGSPRGFKHSPETVAKLSLRTAGIKNPRAHSVVRLIDQKIYDYGRQAASEIDGTDTGISEAIRFGSYHRGYQFMLYGAWVAAGKPTRHPLNVADPLIEMPTREELEKLIIHHSLRRVGEQYGRDEATVRRWVKSFEIITPDKRKKQHPPTAAEIDSYLQGHTWNEAAQHFDLCHKTIRKWLRAGGYNPATYDKRPTQIGAKNPCSRRIVRLFNGTIFETQGEVARVVKGWISGISIAARKGRLHRGEQFMFEDEWIAAGKPKQHPLSKR